MCVQKINHENVIDPVSYTPKEDCFVVWDLENNVQVQNFELMADTSWPDWSMAPSINARIQGTQLSLRQEEQTKTLLPGDKSQLQKELRPMSRISKFAMWGNACCGSHQGQLYLFKFDGLILDSAKVQDFHFDFQQKTEMTPTRVFNAHTSMLTAIENFQDKHLVTSAVEDQCVIHWEVGYEDQKWDLDFNRWELYQDPYAEVLEREKFERF